MLFIRSWDLIHLITEGLYPFTNLSLFLLPKPWKPMFKTFTHFFKLGAILVLYWFIKNTLKLSGLSPTIMYLVHKSSVWAGVGLSWDDSRLGSELARRGLPHSMGAQIPSDFLQSSPFPQSKHCSTSGWELQGFFWSSLASPVHAKSLQFCPTLCGHGL